MNIDELLARLDTAGQKWALQNYWNDINDAAAAIRQLRGSGEPEEPTEEMWSGLARDIIFWHDMSDVKRTPRSLFAFLDNLGRDIPDWLRNEQELQNLDHAISKGTRAVIIYRAMLAARPAQGAQNAEPVPAAPTQDAKDAARWREHQKVMAQGRLPHALHMRFTAERGGEVWQVEAVLDTEVFGEKSVLGIKAVGLAAEQQVTKLFSAIDAAMGKKS